MSNESLAVIVFIASSIVLVMVFIWCVILYREVKSIQGQLDQHLKDHLNIDVEATSLSRRIDYLQAIMEDRSEEVETLTNRVNDFDDELEDFSEDLDSMCEDIHGFDDHLDHISEVTEEILQKALRIYRHSRKGRYR